MGWWVWAKTVGLMGMGQEKCCRCQTTPKKKMFVKWSILAPFSYSQFLSALPSFWLFLVGWLWFIFLLAGSGLIIISRNILLCCRVRICLNDIIIFCQSIPILFRMSWFYPLGWFPNPHGLQNAWCLVRRNIILAVDLVVDILCTVSAYVRSLLVNVWILVISCRYYFFISADNPDMLNLYFSYCMFCFQQWNFQLPTRNSGNDKFNIPSPVGLPISLTTNVFDGARVPHFVG